MLVKLNKEKVLFLSKKSIIFCLDENILFSGVQFKIHLFIFLSFLSRLHMNFLCGQQNLWIWAKHEKPEGYRQASKIPLPNGMTKRLCDLLLLARWCVGTKHLRVFFLLKKTKQNKTVLTLSTSSDSLYWEKYPKVDFVPLFLGKELCVLLKIVLTFSFKWLMIIKGLGIGTWTQEPELSTTCPLGKQRLAEE